MPALKTRKTSSKSSKLKKPTKVKRSVKALKAKVAGKVARARTPAKPRSTRKPKVLAAPPRPQTDVYMAPHHVDHHRTEVGFHVHPAPTMHPVGPMAMKHPRSVSRHH